LEKFYYKDDYSTLIHADSLQYLDEIEKESVDVIVADPPYFLSNDGITNSGGKMVSVNKGSWDKRLTLEEKHQFNKTWIQKCKNILTPNGTIWISGTLHNIYSIGMALQEEGYKILNNITWEKLNPPPNLSTRVFTHSTETILWARKDTKDAKHYYNYDRMKEMNHNKQMKDVWSGPLTKPSEKTFGKHPTQKPEYLVERILLASTKENDLILDPFIGSGTTAVVAKKMERNIIGIDSNKEYLEIAKQRLDHTNIQGRLF
jgi:site-specific DNA-methyltransferase (adenine-specific)